MLRRILVATDFSEPSDAARAHARRLAERTGATLHVLHVVDHLFVRRVFGHSRDCGAATMRRLQEQMVESELDATLVVAQCEAPADEITRYARAHDVDLVVMGTHGRGGMARLLLGSVAETVARTAPCPVLTTRAAPPLAALHRLRILVPIDFSRSSDEALGWAKRLAATLGGSIRVLHVVEHPTIAAAFGPELYVPQSIEARADQVNKARMRLSRRILIDSRSRVRTTSDVVFGRAATTIPAYVGDSGFDLVVMGALGRSGLSHRLMGSIAESVIRTARCPVLTVKAAHLDYTRTADFGATPVAV